MSPREKNFNRGGPSICGAYGAIADLASAAWRAAAGLRSRAGRVRAAGTSVTVRGCTQRGPSCRAGGMAAHAERPRAVAGRRGVRPQGRVWASAGAASGESLGVGGRACGACRAPARGGQGRWGAPRGVGRRRRASAEVGEDPVDD